MPFDLQLTLLRHGRTSANERHLYAGSTDVALSDAGISDARRSGICDSCGLVYVSPLLRARQTARICFPNARQVVCDGLREMDFGAFEGRSADDMADDADYRRWVDSNCTLPCPGGESRAQLICRAGQPKRCDRRPWRHHHGRARGVRPARRAGRRVPLLLVAGRQLRGLSGACAPRARWPRVRPPRALRCPAGHPLGCFVCANRPLPEFLPGIRWLQASSCSKMTSHDDKRLCQTIMPMGG